MILQLTSELRSEWLKWFCSDCCSILQTPAKFDKICINNALWYKTTFSIETLSVRSTEWSGTVLEESFSILLTTSEQKNCHQLFISSRDNTNLVKHWTGYQWWQHCIQSWGSQWHSEIQHTQLPLSPAPTPCSPWSTLTLWSADINTVVVNISVTCHVVIMNMWVAMYWKLSIEHSRGQVGNMEMNNHCNLLPQWLCVWCETNTINTRHHFHITLSFVPSNQCLTKTIKTWKS